MQINKSNLKNENEYIEIIDIFVKDGIGLTVELKNTGNFNVKNIKLDIKIDSNKFVIIPNKIYEISYLAAGDSDKVHIFIFGFNRLLLSDCSLFSITVSSPNIETFMKIFSINIFGLRTKIVEEFSSLGEPYEGYTLFGPEYSTNTYLINIDGKIVYTWKSNYIQGLATYLLENGELLRLDEFGGNIRFTGGGRAGRIEKFNKDSNLLWEFVYSNKDHCSHHDIEPLRNGNILLIAWEYKTSDEALEAGRNPKLLLDALWPDHIIEVKPTGPTTGDIVWEWHVWDHLIQDYDPTKENYGIIEDHPELIDINFCENEDRDWNHINAVDYNSDLDQILLSVHHFNEIWIIDHSTTTQEAAGHTGGKSGKGGDLLYRWGNPQAYRAGDASDQQFFGQHGANWIEKNCPGEGNILVFNNGDLVHKYSSILEIVTPVDDNGNYNINPGQAEGPERPIWVYISENPSDMYSFWMSSVQRLPNGNTLMCSAIQGLFIEVTQYKEIVWEYQNILPTNANNAVAMIIRYSSDYPGIPKVKNIDKI